MTRATIDFGIDLGTTNSAIAVVNDGRVDVIKNNDGQETTPSAVQILRSGTVLVGRKAYEHLRTRYESNAYGGFKRRMGTKEKFAFPSAAVERSPEELAAEVLKSLRADAEAWSGEHVQAAVITVPAAFELAQCEATQRAAALAGIRQAPLLQEPIAAGLAYGYDNEVKSGYFLVYDLGGGTFDVSLVRVDAGRLQVVDHDGDNFLGGRDWDDRFADLLVDRLTAIGCRLWTRSDQVGREFFRLLGAFAEPEKIRLSRAREVDVVFDGSLRDAAGQPIDTTVTVRRAEYEALIRSDIVRTIEVTQRLLTSQKLGRQAVERVVLVGGPTNTPLLRGLVADDLGIPIETRLDPMTVVAEGAARFAAGVIAEKTRPDQSSAVGTSSTRNSVEFHVAYPPVADTTEVYVGGRVQAGAAEGLVVEVRRQDGGWSSGRMPVTDAVFFATLPLTPRRTNVFELACFDAAGSRVAATPEQLAITHGLAAADPPLARTLAVVALDDDGHQVCRGMLSKGTSLPAVNERTFRTVREIRRGSADDILDIHVVEGEYERPDLNRHVGHLRFTGVDVDRLLPAGMPIEVKLRVDASRGVTATAYVPYLDLTVEDVLQNKYVPSVDPDTIERDLELELRRAREVTVGNEDAFWVIATAARDIKRHLAAASSGVAERADQAERLLKDLKATIDDLEKDSEAERLAETVRKLAGMTADSVSAFGDGSAGIRLAHLQRDAADAIEAEHVDRLRHVRAELGRLWVETTWHAPEFWVEMFASLLDASIPNADGPAYDRLARRGRAALANEDLDDLRMVCMELMSLLPDHKHASVAPLLRNVLTR